MFHENFVANFVHLKPAKILGAAMLSLGFGVACAPSDIIGPVPTSYYLATPAAKATIAPLPTRTPTIPVETKNRMDLLISNIKLLQRYDGAGATQSKIPKVLESLAALFTLLDPNVNSNQKPLKDRLHLVTADGLADKLANESHFPQTDKERDDIKNYLLETEIGGEIWLNTTALNQVGQDILKDSSVMSQLPPGTDPTILAYISATMHDMAHTTQSNEIVKFDMPVYFDGIDKDGKRSSIPMDSMVGWRFMGKDPDDVPVYASGLVEAITEHRARIMTKEYLGGYLFNSSKYRDGAILIAKIANELRINDKELASYGQIRGKSNKDFINRLTVKAGNDQGKALRVLQLVALVTQGNETDLKKALTEINELLNTKINMVNQDSNSIKIVYYDAQGQKQETYLEVKKPEVLGKIKDFTYIVGEPTSPILESKTLVLPYGISPEEVAESMGLVMENPKGNHYFMPVSQDLVEV